MLLVELPPILLHIRSRRLIHSTVARESIRIYIHCSCGEADKQVQFRLHVQTWQEEGYVPHLNTRRIIRAWVVVPLYIAFSERPTHFNIYFTFNRQREMARSQGYGCNSTTRIPKSFTIPFLQRSQPASNFLRTALCNCSHDADSSFLTVVCCTSCSHSYISISAA